MRRTSHTGTGALGTASAAPSPDSRGTNSQVSETQLPYHSLVESIDGIVWEADGETFRFTFVSKQAERILGYPVSEWVNDPQFWINHLHPDDGTGSSNPV